MAELGARGNFGRAFARGDRVARARAGLVAARGPADRARLAGQRAQRFGHGARCARTALARLAALAARFAAALAAGSVALSALSASAQVTSTRIWPAKDYTRVTFEAKAPLKYSVFGVKDPERVVLDIEGVEL